MVVVASDLFRRKGFAATTTRELAAALGLQKATIYHHIRRKEDLLYDMSIASLRRMHAAADQVLALDQNPLDTLRKLIAVHLQTALDDRDRHATMLIELRFLPEPQRDEVLGLRRNYETKVERAIAAAQSAGSVRSDIPAKDLRLALLNLMNWTIFWYQPNGPRSAENLGLLYADLFLDGARAQSSALLDDPRAIQTALG